ncbi:VOC family protein [Enemella evansiae]|uniref:VOC family protein n=1 Tax=Enemella evansiae TaxID=2016499 RepID=UPI001E3EE4E3|nr:VOC family protein [Enemella evansiae]
MSLHGLSHIVMGVPNVEETAAYYEEFGLGRGEQNRFSTRDGGEQLHIVSEPRRRLVELGVRADDPDDLDRIAVALTKLGFEHERPDAETLTSTDPVTNIRAKIKVAERISQQSEPTPYNGPGRIERYGRAPGIVREDRVRPRKLGHVVSGTVDLQATTRFLVDGLGFQVSDYIGDKGAFLRCSNDHHNFLALAAPVSYLHHSSWQVDDIDDVGRGHRDAGGQPGAAHLGAGSALCRVKLLLVSQGSRRELLRVLLRSRCDPRGRDLGPAGDGGSPGALQLGSAAASVLPGTGGSGRPDGGCAQPPVTEPTASTQGFLHPWVDLRSRATDRGRKTADPRCAPA